MPAPVTTAVWGQETWSPVLIEALSVESAVLRAGATRVVTDGRIVHLPVLRIAPDADWVAELDPLPSDAGDGDTLALTPKKIANAINLSNESIQDSPVDQLDTIGRAMVRGVAHKLDLRFFSNAAATAIAPAGLLHYTLPATDAAINVDIAGIFTAIGVIEAAGGNPDTVFVSAADVTKVRLQALTAGFMLTADPTAPGVQRIGGATLIPAPLPAGTAVVCEARYIALAVREDAEVDFSGDAGFLNDSTVARVRMRVDWAPSDPAAFCVVTT